jgi:hypothetical protein
MGFAKIHENSTNELIKNLNKNYIYEMEVPNAQGIADNVDYHVYHYPRHARPYV